MSRCGYRVELGYVRCLRRVKKDVDWEEISGFGNYDVILVRRKCISFWRMGWDCRELGGFWKWGSGDGVIFFNMVVEGGKSEVGG